MFSVECTDLIMDLVIFPTVFGLDVWNMSISAICARRNPTYALKDITVVMTDRRSEKTFQWAVSAADRLNSRIQKTDNIIELFHTSTLGRLKPMT